MRKSGKMKILYLSTHAILEFDEVGLFHELGLDVFSPGAYIEPDNPRDLSLRPGIPDLVYDSKDLKMFHALGKPGINNKELLTKEFVDRFDVVMVMHIPLWVTKNWEAIKDKIVIWRTIGQSTSNVESDLAPYRKKGLKIVRYSPAERTIPNYIGEDAVIRFYKDPDEFKDWNGNTEQVINITQSMPLRRVACNYDMFLKATEGFPRKLFGTHNETASNINGGIVTYDQLKQELRNNRVYFYTGTHPASYTLNFIEAAMTGIPIVAIGPKKGNMASRSDCANLYEIPNIINNRNSGFYSDDIQELRDFIQILMNDKNYAKTISRNGRAKAIEMFGKEKIKEQWKIFWENFESRTTV